MKKYHFMTKDPAIREYVHDMANWITENSEYTYDQVLKMFTRNREQIEDLFKPYAETIFHDEPAKWAELLAISWGLIEEEELEFV